MGPSNAIGTNAAAPTQGPSAISGKGAVEAQGPLCSPFLWGPEPPGPADKGAAEAPSGRVPGTPRYPEREPGPRQRQGQGLAVASPPTVLLFSSSSGLSSSQTDQGSGS